MSTLELQRTPTDAPVPSAGDDDEGPRKLVMTLGVEAAQLTRALGADLGISNAEVVRRGLMLLEFLNSLEDDEELVVRNRKDKTVERVRFQWSL